MSRPQHITKQQGKGLAGRPPRFKFKVSDKAGRYTASGTLSREDIIQGALYLLARDMEQSGNVLNTPMGAKSFLRLSLSQEGREVFACIFLNSQHKVIAYEHLFYGTIDTSAVYPREVVKRALELNAKAVIFAHNHPSGNPEPSEADKIITNRLIEALALVEVNVLDHIVIGVSPVSFAERGLI